MLSHLLCVCITEKCPAFADSAPTIVGSITFSKICTSYNWKQATKLKFKIKNILSKTWMCQWMCAMCIVLQSLLRSLANYFRFVKLSVHLFILDTCMSCGIFWQVKRDIFIYVLIQATGQLSCSTSLLWCRSKAFWNFTSLKKTL